MTLTIRMMNTWKNDDDDDKNDADYVDDDDVDDDVSVCQAESPASLVR